MITIEKDNRFAVNSVHHFAYGIHLCFLNGADNLFVFHKPLLFIRNLYVYSHANILVTLSCQVLKGIDKIADKNHDGHQAKDYFENFEHDVFSFFCQQSTVNGQRTAVFYLFSKMVWNSFM